MTGGVLEEPVDAPTCERLRDYAVMHLAVPMRVTRTEHDCDHLASESPKAL